MSFCWNSVAKCNKLREFWNFMVTSIQDYPKHLSSNYNSVYKVCYHLQQRPGYRTVHCVLCGKSIVGVLEECNILQDSANQKILCVFVLVSSAS